MLECKYQRVKEAVKMYELKLDNIKKEIKAIESVEGEFKGGSYRKYLQVLYDLKEYLEVKDDNFSG